MGADNVQTTLRNLLAKSGGCFADARSQDGNSDPANEFERVLALLNRFVARTDDPSALVALFQREQAAIAAIGPLFAASPSLAERLTSDPRSFDLLRAADASPLQRSELIRELDDQLSDIRQPSQAALIIRRFVSQQILRIAYGEFVRGELPDVVGRQLAHVADAMLTGGLQFTLRRLADRRGMPECPDGSTPEVTVIGLGSLGGEEMSYNAPMKVVFLYDAIDHKNVWHRKFYAKLVDDLVRLLCGDSNRNMGVDIDLREGPRHEVGVHICGFREAARIYETSGRTVQRMSFVKARVVAGSQSLGKAFLDRMEPWVYRQFITRVERTEIRAVRHKLERRTAPENATVESQDDLLKACGGLHDLESTVQYLQLVHGGQHRSVRLRNTLDAVNGLHRAGHLSDDDRSQFAENYARLFRLSHQLSVKFDSAPTVIPSDRIGRQTLAWQLGIRASKGSGGDAERFSQMLSDTLAKNRLLIARLLAESTGDESETPAETDLLLDFDPDPRFVEQTLRRYKLKHPRSAMTDLASLSTETVPFLSPLRCRHVFSSIAPTLLEEVSSTPDPDGTLHSMVRVTDSLGAKATLWELLGDNHPTMQLVVRLCATTPYLSGILTNNPGMIDELIDSLLMNRLPSADRLDAHSIELCKGAADIDDILRSFKSSAHLMIGVRDMLGKETLEATHQAIADTAEACLRRVIGHEQEVVAEQFGDPVDSDGKTVEMVTLALGKLGGREPNYHSDLDAIFLYSDAGETERRVGGRRSTTTNHRFFNQVARQVFDRINGSHPLGQLYELDSKLHPIDEAGPMAVSVDEFMNQFQSDAAPLWMRLALCKARAISGSRKLRKQTDSAIANVIVATRWQSAMAGQICQMRIHSQETAEPENLKRGIGGTMDVELVAQMLMLRHAGQERKIIHQGTTASLAALESAGFLSSEHAQSLTKGYRALRRIEASLRLMDTPARHELPSDQESMNKLAFLMGEPGPDEIREQSLEARKRNREAFDAIFDQAGHSK